MKPGDRYSIPTENIEDFIKSSKEKYPSFRCMIFSDQENPGNCIVCVSRIK